MSKLLAPAYNVQIDQVGKREWSELIKLFDDATIYQSWSYGSVRWSEDNLSHLVLRKRNDVVAAAQSRIVKLPFIGAGIAYITWGPLWRIHGRENNLEHFRQMICALREEYVIKRSLFLRIVPSDIDDGSNTIRSILEAEGLKWQSSVSSYRTFLMDLSLSLDELRKGLAQKWRNRLNRAERNNLEVMEGTGNKLYEMFSSIYKEMLERKRFLEFVDIKEFGLIQEDLYDPLKMQIMICQFEGNPVCALICSAIGDRGIYLLGATSNNGLKSQGTYLLQWRTIEWLKARGCLWYDLGGIDPEKNPGTYHFKAGLCGKSGKEVRHLGQFDMCQSLISAVLVKTGDQLRAISRKIRFATNRLCARSKT